MVKVIQTNFTAGVIDTLTEAREDTEMYYNGLSRAVNMYVQPVGGLTARGGLQKICRLAGKLTAISLSAATVTAPNGGVAANVKDGDVSTRLSTTNTLSTTTPFVIAHVDFGTAKSVSGVDILDYFLSAGSLDDEIRVQSSPDNATWSDYSPPFNWGTAPRTRRRRAGTVSARYWRLVRIGGTSVPATASVSEIRFWSEGQAETFGRLLGFSENDETAYMMAITDGNIDIVSGDDVVGSIAVPYAAGDLPIVNSAKSLDTLLLFHPDYQPYRIFKQGDGDEFDSRKQDFENIPKYDYGAGTGGVNEVQVLNDAGSVVSGDGFTISLEGHRTTTIVVAATRADTASNIQTALRNLENTSAGGITVSSDSNGFTVTFGGEDGSRPWLEMDVDVLLGNGVFTVSRIQEGEYPGESVVSDARGWFRCGAFYQGRLYLAGAKGKPNAIAASKVSDFFNMDINAGDATAGLFLPLDTNKTSKIFQMVAGRHLSVFASDAESYFLKEPIDAETIIKQTTSAGISEGVRVHDMDGALIFTDASGAAVREFLYTFDQQSYLANNLSYKAGNLIGAGIVDADLRRAASPYETDQLYLVNRAGEIVVMNAMRSQSVPGAFTLLSLRQGDKFKAVGVDDKKRVYAITERSIGGVATGFIERINDDHRLDCSTIISVSGESVTASAAQTVFSYGFSSPALSEEVGVRLNGFRLSPADYTVNLAAKTVTLHTAASAGDVVRMAAMKKTVSGADDLNGETVTVIVDGVFQETALISGGGFTLGAYADMSVEYGFDFAAEGKLLPVRIPGQETLIGEKLRVPNVVLSLHETEGIEISVNGGAYYEVPLRFLDSPILDRAASSLKFTGIREIKGFTGWGDGSLAFRKPRPGRMTIRSITREVMA